MLLSRYLLSKIPSLSYSEGVSIKHLDILENYRIYRIGEWLSFV